MTRYKRKTYYPTLLLAIVAAVLCAAHLAVTNADEPAAEQQAPADSNTPPEAPESPVSPSEDSADDTQLPDNSVLAELYGYFDRVFNEQFVTKTGQVDYALLRRKRTDLYNAVRILETLHPAVLMSLPKEERIAFWINTHNICTLKLIIDNYPIQPKWYMLIYPNNSIMQIPGAWDKVFFKIMGLEYNLKEMRNELLLDRYKDPRICFALNDAARGGAILRQEPIKPEQLDEQLDDQVRNYLAYPQGFRLDTEKNTIYLSNVFSMNKTVFLASEYASILKFRTRKPEERAWLNFLFKFLPQKDAAYLDLNDVQIQFINYDWTLNEK